MTWKIFLFAGLGLMGLVLIGVGSWMLLLPGVQGFGSVQTDQPNPIETSFPTTMPAPTFSFTTETQSSTQVLQGSKTPAAALTEAIVQTPTPTPTAWQACPNAFLSHLRVGMKVKLSEDPPLPNRVRESANTTAKIVGMIQPGEIVEIMDGPGCSNNWVWWKIRKSDGVTGWTAEGDGQDYWLLPEVP
jgi:hypothetical protein